MKFVTVTNDRYLPGTVALLKSIKKNSGIENPEFIILLGGELTKRKKLEQIGLPLEFINPSDLGHVDAKRFGRIQPHFKTSVQKLTLFNLDVDKVCYVDSDIICTSDISEMIVFEHFTGTHVNGIKLDVKFKGHPMFSGGKWIARPSKKLFGEIIEHLYTTPKPKTKSADQWLLNSFFWTKYPKDVKILGMEWEMLNRVYALHPAVWRKHKPKFIHYCGARKPWMGGLGGRYKGVEKIWWDIYNGVC